MKRGNKLRIIQIKRKRSLFCTLCIICILFSNIPLVAAAKNNAVNAEIDSINKVVVITGTVQPVVQGAYVTIVITNPGKSINGIDFSEPVFVSEEINQVDQIAYDGTGYYQYTYTLGETDAGGIYTVYAGGKKGAGLAQTSFYYIDVSEQQNIVAALKLCAGESDIINFLQDFGLILHINMDVYQRLEDKTFVHDALLQNKLNYINVYDIERVFNEATAVQDINESKSQGDIEGMIITHSSVLLPNVKEATAYNDLSHKGLIDEHIFSGKDYHNVQQVRTVLRTALAISLINEAARTAVGQILVDYDDVLQLSAASYSKYTALKDKIPVYKAMTDQDFTSLRGVKEAFDTAVDAQHLKENQPAKGSASKTGSQAAYPTISAQTENPPTEIPSHPPYEQPEFADIAGVPWAIEGIEYLASKGVINGVEENLFKPDDNITREQFIKMLILGLNLSVSAPDVTFQDVEKDAWYYPYIAAAYNLGITKGISDDDFGVGMNMSRQEMAVFIYRAAQIAQIQLSQSYEQAPFYDSEHIEPYAFEAVDKMRQAGIVNGVGDNRFAPKDYCSRAQVAKVIYEFVKLGM
ncbi:MAG: S-layer homology domain-containing protein [Firmicutes bacterium]|nr:S-layer homology domain-containing protein [Bacillota bacterium]